MCVACFIGMQLHRAVIILIVNRLTDNSHTHVQSKKNIFCFTNSVSEALTFHGIHGHTNGFNRECTIKGGSATCNSVLAKIKKEIK